MDDMMSRISEILDDPAQAEKIKQLASSMFSSGADSPASAPEASAGPDTSAVAASARPVSPQSFAQGFSGSDFASVASTLSGLLGNSSIMRKMPSSESINRNINLLNAIKPFMRQERATRLTSAMKVMQFISVIAKMK